ncbi:hypothetical protein A3Q56_04153 [Intoshia linei]|uniref:C2H2-type domain-containing protein n=1 Tax=Intoshia linei TaxID=1819745 RepID=A0A177B1C6_9BILA|nr:hypothetical protein A3Q56_04153 [Intoshia linei]
MNNQGNNDPMNNSIKKKSEQNEKQCPNECNKENEGKTEDNSTIPNENICLINNYENDANFNSIYNTSSEKYLKNDQDMLMHPTITGNTQNTGNTMNNRNTIHQNRPNNYNNINNNNLINSEFQMNFNNTYNQYIQNLPYPESYHTQRDPYEFHDRNLSFSARTDGMIPMPIRHDESRNRTNVHNDMLNGSQQRRTIHQMMPADNLNGQSHDSNRNLQIHEERDLSYPMRNGINHENRVNVHNGMNVFNSVNRINEVDGNVNSLTPVRHSGGDIYQQMYPSLINDPTHFNQINPMDHTQFMNSLNPLTPSNPLNQQNFINNLINLNPSNHVRANEINYHTPDLTGSYVPNGHTRSNSTQQYQFNNSTIINPIFCNGPINAPVNMNPSDTNDEDSDEIQEPHICRWAIDGRLNGEPCNKCFNTIAELVNHLQLEHINQSNEDGNYYVCFWHKCIRNGAPFKARYKLVNHLRVHTGEKPFKCTLCKSRFARSENMKIHNRDMF